MSIAPRFSQRIRPSRSTTYAGTVTSSSAWVTSYRCCSAVTALLYPASTVRPLATGEVHARKAKRSADGSEPWRRFAEECPPEHDRDDWDHVGERRQPTGAHPPQRIRPGREAEGRRRVRRSRRGRAPLAVVPARSRRRLRARRG